jgi:phosphoenolpyruvate synthase/pyruvate phosphate dikinase
MIRRVIESAHAAGAKVGLCGQAPSNQPEFAEFLVDCGQFPCGQASRGRSGAAQS